MKKGFVGDLWSPTWQSVTEAKAGEKDVAIVTTTVSHSSKKMKMSKGK